MSTIRITATGRLLTCAALALGLTGLSHTVARAQDPEVTNTRNVDNTWTGSDIHPCTKETIDLEGKQVLVTKSKESGRTTFFKFTTRESGTGTVVGSPNRFKWSNFVENETRTTTCKFTVRFENRKKIIPVPQGQIKNYFLQQMETFKFNNCQLIQVEPPVKNKESTCN